jgi:arylsulfatase
LRADHLGCYGYHRQTSPNIDAFARESLLFEWAFSQAPNTPPSQTSILTGLYPSTHGMVYDEDRVPEEVVTLAEALAALGYATAGFHDGGYMRDAFRIDRASTYDDNATRAAVIGPKVTPAARAPDDSAPAHRRPPRPAPPAPAWIRWRGPTPG